MDQLLLPSLLHDHFDFQVRRVPDAIALRQGQKETTFAELDRDSAKVASALAARGIGHGSYVGVHMERSADYVACILGVLKTNAAVVPLPPSYPMQRLTDILRFAELDLVIDSSAHPIDSDVTVHAQTLGNLLLENAPTATFGRGEASQAAFVLCSSGSTGTPKMIVRSHDSFFHRLEWMWRRHPFEAGDVGCQKAHITTTHHLYELFEPLLAGATTVQISDENTRRLEEFWEIVKAEHVTRLLLVPSALRASLEIPGFSTPSLSVLVLMGEYVEPELARRAISSFRSDTSVYSIYGSTEASSTMVCDLRRHFTVGQELPLGEPISADVQPLVRTIDGKPAPIGERGRLFIAGRALFTEYFRDPRLTAASFTSLPDREEMVFDTRDDVCEVSTGDIRFLGRSDETVKVRGFRVNLGEVERVLTSHDDIQEAAVTLEGEGASGLVGFYIPSSVPSASVYAELRARLPEYMVPAVLVGMDEFPRTASGKIDKLMLPSKQGAGRRSSTRGRPLSDTEQNVAKCWASILEHEDFGPETSFFETGGTSLTTLSLVNRLRVEFDLRRDQLSELAVYQFPTLETLSSHIETVMAERASRSPVRLTPLVTLRHAPEPDREPLFLVSSAGGTLGAYNKLVKALDAGREIIGIRDPYLWGDRDPTVGFEEWVDVYLNALRERQPSGPYFIGAYSSAGAFAYEMAVRLREHGETVSLLALIDPLGIESEGRSKFGWWVLNAATARAHVRVGTRAFGYIRRLLLPFVSRYRSAHADQEGGITEQEFAAHRQQVHSDRNFIRLLSALFELNTELPLCLSDESLNEVAPEKSLTVFQDHISTVIPDFDAKQLDRIATQYHLQVNAQYSYAPRNYDGRVLVVEPMSHYAGLLGAQLAPFSSDFRSLILPLGEPPERIREITRCFAAYQPHFRSMRDNLFVNELARELRNMIR